MNRIYGMYTELAFEAFNDSLLNYLVQSWKNMAAYNWNAWSWKITFAFSYKFRWCVLSNKTCCHGSHCWDCYFVTPLSLSNHCHSFEDEVHNEFIYIYPIFIKLQWLYQMCGYQFTSPSKGLQGDIPHCTIINLRWTWDCLRFIMGNPIQIRLCLLCE